VNVRWLDDTEPLIRAALTRIDHAHNLEKFNDDDDPPSPPGTALGLPQLRLDGNFEQPAAA
jgi:hypothetical protein